MNQLVEHKLQCPYCGEPIVVLIDNTVECQEYVEDCQVCCRPIAFDVSISFDGEIDVMASHENE
ncbi:MAG: CPXCG motif-containing cysteine-rich protein [Pseudomonadales bacterium]|nr:CPXCG motif-containing cysteine-rich protein [Pseudomonadales bacterium]